LSDVGLLRDIQKRIGLHGNFVPAGIVLEHQAAHGVGGDSGRDPQFVRLDQVDSVPGGLVPFSDAEIDDHRTRRAAGSAQLGKRSAAHHRALRPAGDPQAQAQLARAGAEAKERHGRVTGAVRYEVPEFRSPWKAEPRPSVGGVELPLFALRSWGPRFSREPGREVVEAPADRSSERGGNSHCDGRDDDGRADSPPAASALPLQPGTSNDFAPVAARVDRNEPVQF
jgi:hypothetical protein